IRAMVEHTLETYGAIDVLINNATAPIQYSDVASVEWADIERHLEVQVKGAFLCSRYVIPSMSARNFGRIVNIGSSNADNVPPARQVGYISAKLALLGLSKCLAAELGTKGITVNVVAPGMTDTDLSAGVPERARLLCAMQTPLRRLAQPSDVADVVAFLVSPA